MIEDKANDNCCVPRCRMTGGCLTGTSICAATPITGPEVATVAVDKQFACCLHFLQKQGLDVFNNGKGSNEAATNGKLRLLPVADFVAFPEHKLGRLRPGTAAHQSRGRLPP